MKSVKICLKGEKIGLPTRHVESDGDGWCLAPMPENGIVIAIDNIEQNTGGLFISEKTLRSWQKELNEKKSRKKQKKKPKDLKSLATKYRKK